jgi:hypothetical protein
MVIGEIKGSAVPSFGSSSSSLQEEKQVMHNMTKRRQEQVQLKNSNKITYDARRLKYSISPIGTEALSAAAELEEANSSTRFLFLSMPVSSECTGEGDVDELVSSSDSSASSPS